MIFGFFYKRYRPSAAGSLNDRRSRSVFRIATDTLRDATMARMVRNSGEKYFTDPLLDWARRALPTLSRHSATLALAGEAAILALGGALKRKESLSAVRERIVAGVYRGRADDGIERVERAFDFVHEVEPVRRKAADAGYGDDHAAAEAAGVTTRGEAARLRAAEYAVRAAIVVDDFAAGELSRAIRDRRSRPASRQERTTWEMQSM